MNSMVGEYIVLIDLLFYGLLTRKPRLGLWYKSGAGSRPEANLPVMSNNLII